MFATVIGELRGIAGRLDPEVVDTYTAARLLDDVAVVEKLTDAIKTLLAARAAASGRWRRDGARDEADWLARKTGTTRSRARETLSASERVRSQPEVEAALRKGELSGEQAAAVTDAAAADPACASSMLRRAKRDSLTNLRRERDRIVAAACPDPDERHRRIRAGRYLRLGTDAEGAGTGSWRVTPEVQAELRARLAPFIEAVFEQARAEGRRESSDAYAADALVDLARAATAATWGGDGEATAPDDGKQARGATPPAPTDEATGPTSPTGPAAPPAPTGPPPPAPAPAPAKRPPRHSVPTKIIVRIDHDALVRGYTVAGETCDVGGAPVPVSVVEEMMASGDVFLTAIVTKGVDVTRVVHLGRGPSAHQLTALQWRDVVCSRVGCTSHPHEWDHNEPFAEVKVTTLDNLHGFCKHDHDLKTYGGFRVVASDVPGKVDLVPPEEPGSPAEPLVHDSG